MKRKPIILETLTNGHFVDLKPYEFANYVSKEHQNNENYYKQNHLKEWEQ